MQLCLLHSRLLGTPFTNVFTHYLQMRLWSALLWLHWTLRVLNICTGIVTLNCFVIYIPGEKTTVHAGVQYEYGDTLRGLYVHFYDDSCPPYLSLQYTITVKYLSGCPLISSLPGLISRQCPSCRRNSQRSGWLHLYIDHLLNRYRCVWSTLSNCPESHTFLLEVKGPLSTEEWGVPNERMHSVNVRFLPSKHLVLQPLDRKWSTHLHYWSLSDFLRLDPGKEIPENPQ